MSREELKAELKTLKNRLDELADVVAADENLEGEWNEEKTSDLLDLAVTKVRKAVLSLGKVRKAK